MVIHHNRLERVNLHVRAQRIVERDVAIAHLKALASVGGIARALHDFLRDVFEDFRELAGTRSRLIEVGPFSAIAEVPLPRRTPSPTALRIGSCGVIARNRLHELVFFRGSRSVYIGTRVRVLENANGIHRSARVFHSFRGGNGVRGDFGLEFAVRSRRAIGEENNDLFSIGTVGGLTLRKLQTVVGARCAIGSYCIDLALESALRLIGARRHVFHDLAVVILVPFLAIRVVADSLSLVSGELHDRNLMLLRRIGNARILRCNLVDKRIRGTSQSVDAFSTGHGVVHRP